LPLNSKFASVVPVAGTRKVCSLLSHARGSSAIERFANERHNPSAFDKTIAAPRRRDQNGVPTLFQSSAQWPDEHDLRYGFSDGSTRGSCFMINSVIVRAPFGEK
jgi:hypothetical protein